MTSMQSALQRKEALLGERPVMTFQPDPSDPATCCSIRLEKHSAGRFLGLVLDRSAFADRVRLGMRPRFVVHHEAHEPVVCGEADVKVLGRVADDGEGPPQLDARAALLVKELSARFPYAPRGLVVVEVKPAAVALDDGEGPSVGAVPRT